jgi:hypothetical protein
LRACRLLSRNTSSCSKSYTALSSGKNSRRMIPGRELGAMSAQGRPVDGSQTAWCSASMYTSGHPQIVQPNCMPPPSRVTFCLMQLKQSFTSQPGSGVMAM